MGTGECTGRKGETTKPVSTELIQNIRLNIRIALLMKASPDSHTYESASPGRPTKSCSAYTFRNEIFV
ncbi:MAG TPA: hypothetical protein PLV96_12735, partial [Methanoregulaceae archaeon]|nr:hypothetical protein [Methanoregulaceae archaeon]